MQRMTQATYLTHPPIGFIGIGNMGFAMLTRLASLNWPTAVCDIDPIALNKAQAMGVSVFQSAAQIAQHCRITFLVVVDAAQVDEVLNGPEGYFLNSKPGDVLFLCPTLGPLEVAQFAAQAKIKDVSLIDSPMSGGPDRAKMGQMSLMLAGPQIVLQRHTNLLNALTTQLFFISEIAGDAAKTKLANNLLAAINLAGASEILAMAQSWGLDAQTTLSVMQASSGQSWIGQDRMQRALQNDFEPRAHTTLLTKDTRLALETCQALGVKTPQLGQWAAACFAAACESGYADRDDASLFLHAGGNVLNKGLPSTQ
jgi:3-hydroxyisobutyrate dehydrogenase